MYHPFNTKTECEIALESLHYAMADVAAAHGFTIIPPYYVVSKNAQTGEDNPAAITTKWADPVELADGRWGIPSFRNSFPTSFNGLESKANLPQLEDVKILIDDESDENVVVVED